MHKQPVYKDAPAYINGVSEAIFKIGMCLPAGPWVTDEDVYYIVECIKEAIVKIIDENTAFLTTTLTTLSVANTFVNADFIYTVVCSVPVLASISAKRAKYSPPDAS